MVYRLCRESIIYSVDIEKRSKIKTLVLKVTSFDFMNEMAPFDIDLKISGQTIF